VSISERVIVYTALVVLLIGLMWTCATGKAGAEARDLTLRHLRVQSITLVDHEGDARSEWRLDEDRGTVVLGGAMTEVSARKYEMRHGKVVAGALGVQGSQGAPYLAFNAGSSTEDPLLLIEPGLFRMTTPGHPTHLIELAATPNRGAGDTRRHLAQIRVWGELRVQQTSGPDASVLVEGGKVTIKKKAKSKTITAD